jgi:hypothetical protein
MADNVADPHADLPAWCRIGRTVATFSWIGGQSRPTPGTATVFGVTKTRVNVVRTTRGGEPVSDWVNRNDLHHRRPGHSGGFRLADPASQEVTDARAVQKVMALEASIFKVFGPYTGSTIMRQADRKPLNNATDALALLDEIADLVNPLRARLQAQADHEGS